MDYLEVCDVNPTQPIGKLPSYGKLRNKREEKRANNVTTGTAAYAAIQEKKRQECRLKPMKEKCIPEDIMLPSRKAPSTAGRFLETDPPNPNSYGVVVKPLRIQKGKVDYPGWLVELSNPQLQSVVDAKELLATGKPLCELLDPFYQAIMGLDSGITYEETAEIMKRVPLTDKGWSFSHFMFIAGNPHLAKKKGVLQDPLLTDIKECQTEKSSNSQAKMQQGQDQGTQSQQKKENVFSRLYQLPKTEKDSWPSKEDKKASGDENGYSMREMLFYSALLYCEMYDTVQAIGKLYAVGDNIPEPREKVLKREQETGFGAGTAGTRKLGFAEWDRPLPPLPKVSPYITDFPIVGFRKMILQPQGPALMYRRSITTLRPVFLTVKAPEAKKPKDTIKVLANPSRVKAVLELLASQGNCLALLPGVTTIFHLSDTLLQKMQIVKKAKPDAPELKMLAKSTERSIITRLAKDLFAPHGLPPQIARIPPMILFSEGIKLRAICKEVQDQHWSFINDKKKKFRNDVWPLMHVDRIPCGNLRESFVYAFETYLPLDSHLPIIREDALPW